MLSDSRHDAPLTLEALQRRYQPRVPRAHTARTAGQLVDLIVRQHLFEAPGRDYGVVLREVLAADPELKRAYAES